VDAGTIETAAAQRAGTIATGPATKAGNFGWIAWVAYIAFDVMGRWRLSLLSGAVVMGVIVAIEYRHQAVKVTDATALGFFAGMLAVTMVIGTWLIATYNVSIVWAMFAIVFWTSIVIGSPFTLQFARETVPPEVWNQPIFIQTNYRISLLWAILATINVTLGVVMLRSSHPLIVGIAIPAILMIFGIAAGGWYGKHVAAKFKD
jgi:hypothetical protein